MVYFMGKYYQVQFSVGSTTASPTSSNDWEELSRFCAIADEIKLKPNGLGSKLFGCRASFLRGSCAMVKSAIKKQELFCRRPGSCVCPLEMEKS